METPKYTPQLFKIMWRIMKIIKVKYSNKEASCEIKDPMPGYLKTMKKVEISIIPLIYKLFHNFQGIALYSMSFLFVEETCFCKYGHLMITLWKCITFTKSMLLICSEIFALISVHL